MPLELETEIPTPNAVMAPQIVLSTNIINGKLVTSAQITLSAASVGESGNWTACGIMQTIQIPDVEHLDGDISEYQGDVLTIMGGIIQLIGNLNGVRKVL